MHAKSNLRTVTRYAQLRDELRLLARRLKRRIFWSVRYFEMPADVSRHRPAPRPGLDFLVCESAEAFLSFVPVPDKELLSVYLARYEEGSWFVCLADLNGVVCSGWVSRPRDRFYVGEIGSHKAVGGRRVLFNYETIEIMRRRGFYTQLLKEIGFRWCGDTLLIYTGPENIASLSAIKSAGFREINL